MEHAPTSVQNNCDFIRFVPKPKTYYVLTGSSLFLATLHSKQLRKYPPAFFFLFSAIMVLLSITTYKINNRFI